MSTAGVFILTGVVGLAIGAFGLWAAVTGNNEAPSTPDRAKPSRR
jgi:hypothetical protein